MDLRHLKYFTEVAKHLSFTKAASVLHISQPSLSKAIKDFEEELQAPLFYRSSKQLVLTDAGKAVVKNAKNVLEAFDNLTSELTDLLELKKGEIRIGIPPIMGAAFFSKLISRFKQLYPLIHITLTEVGSIAIKQRVRDGTLDIGLICNIPMHEETFETISLDKDPLYVIAHKDNPLTLKKKIRFADLKDESFILYRNDFSLHDKIMEECSKHEFFPDVVCESSQKDFMIEMVEANLGIALLPAKICRRLEHSDLAVLPLLDSDVSLELGMIYMKDKHVPFAVREFISMSHESLKP